MPNIKEKLPEKKTVSASLVLADGTLVETVVTSGGSQFAVCRDGTVSYQPSVTVEGQIHMPLPKTNRLVRHGVMHFPSEAAAYASTDQLMEEIVRYIRRYVDLSSEFERVAAYYVLLSWVYDAFNECPYLRFQGDFGSGKSRALLVIGALAYKGVFASGASTVSPIFHILDNYRGTLIFDETDFRFSDAKADIVKILNNGNTKGFPVLRTMVTPSKEFEPQAFNVYGPKLVAMRNSFEDEALESRFITEHMENRAIRGDIAINLGEAYKAEAATLRNKLLMFRFRNRNQVKINEALQAPALSLRMNQIVLPLLSLMESEEHRQDLLQMAAEGMQVLAERRRESIEARVVKALWRMFQTGPDHPVSLGVLVYRVIADGGESTTRPLTPRYIGSVLKKLGITTYKTAGVYVIPLGQKEVVARLVQAFGLRDDSE